MKFSNNIFHDYKNVIIFINYVLMLYIYIYFILLLNKSIEIGRNICYQVICYEKFSERSLR